MSKQLSCNEYAVSTPLSFIYQEVSTSGSTYLVSASELVYKKVVMPITARSHDSTVYSLRGSLDSLEYLAPAKVFETNVRLSPGVFITRRLDSQG